MVWQSTQSSLYKAVEDFNRRSENEEKSEEKFPEKSEKNNCRHLNGNSNENSPKNSKKNYRKNNCGFRPENCPKKNSPQGIFSDSDMLLVAGILIILINENADERLILALMIVLLG